jgi:hypothetical protein
MQIVNDIFYKMSFPIISESLCRVSKMLIKHLRNPNIKQISETMYD